MKETELENILLVDGIYSKGFGSIGKIIMIDRRLHPYSKVIYSYFTSYAGGGTTAFPSVSKITYDLVISKKTYYKYFNPLVEYGYISVYQQKKDGKFANNIYKLNTNPKKIVPITKEEQKEIDEIKIPNNYYYNWMDEE